MKAKRMTQTTSCKLVQILISVNLVVMLIVLLLDINLSPDDACDRGNNARDERQSATERTIHAIPETATQRQASTLRQSEVGVLLSPSHDEETPALPLRMAAGARAAMTTTHRMDVNEALNLLDRLALLLRQDGNDDDGDKSTLQARRLTTPTTSRLKQQDYKGTKAPTTISSSTRVKSTVLMSSTRATPTTTTSTKRVMKPTLPTSTRTTPRIFLDPSSKARLRMEDATPLNRGTRRMFTSLATKPTSLRPTSATLKSKEKPEVRPLAESAKTRSLMQPHKKVLLWNPEFVHHPGAESLIETIQKPVCRPYDCLLTLDRKLYSQADAVVVHFPMFIRNETLLANELPKSRHRGQQWAFYSRESPARIQPFNFKLFDKMFNITMTYRLDSDVPIPYGRMHRIPERWRQLRREIPRVNRAAGRTKLVAWLVSNCRSEDSWRMEYARELQKYVPVDIYGKCGNLSCPMGNRSNCYKMLSKTYKFYLAFENSLCKDYVTEKLWNYRRHGLVPIVLGGFNYSALPHQSVIDVTTFASVKDVADYIKQLDKNDYLYNKYFDWETDYEVVSGGSYCHLCKFLHKSPNHKKVYDLNNWWSHETTCVKPEAYFKGSADELIRQHVNGVMKHTTT